MIAAPLVQRACRCRLAIHESLRLHREGATCHQHPVTLQGLLRLDAPGDPEGRHLVVLGGEHSMKVFRDSQHLLEDQGIKFFVIYLRERSIR
ncbi:unnamed protein product [Lampetra fluviatilis]